MCAGVRQKKWLAPLLTVNQTWGGRAFRRRKPYIKMCLFTTLTLPPPFAFFSLPFFPTPPPLPPPLPLLPLSLWQTSHQSIRQMNTSSAVLSFISDSHLFINAHKAVAGTYHRQSPLSCLSDETEVAEITKRFYGRMDVTGSGGRSHISLHNIRRHNLCTCMWQCAYTENVSWSRETIL